MAGSYHAFPDEASVRMPMDASMDASWTVG
jgi:hypothetical protein